MFLAFLAVQGPGYTGAESTATFYLGEQPLKSAAAAANNHSVSCELMKHRRLLDKVRLGKVRLC